MSNTTTLSGWTTFTTSHTFLDVEDARWFITDVRINRGYDAVLGWFRRDGVPTVILADYAVDADSAELCAFFGGAVVEHGARGGYLEAPADGHDSAACAEMKERRRNRRQPVTIGKSRDLCGLPVFTVSQGRKGAQFPVSVYGWKDAEAIRDGFAAAIRSGANWDAAVANLHRAFA